MESYNFFHFVFKLSDSSWPTPVLEARFSPLFLAILQWTKPKSQHQLKFGAKAQMHQVYLWFLCFHLVSVSWILNSLGSVLKPLHIFYWQLDWTSPYNSQQFGPLTHHPSHLGSGIPFCQEGNLILSLAFPGKSKIKSSNMITSDVKPSSGS